MGLCLYMTYILEYENNNSFIFLFSWALQQFALDGSIQAYHGLTTQGRYGGLGVLSSVCSDVRWRLSVTNNYGISDQAVAEVIKKSLK